ncbi:hypothetical protein Hanom_Chr03g00241491 [Helianthus anomalus]
MKRIEAMEQDACDFHGLRCIPISNASRSSPRISHSPKAKHKKGYSFLLIIIKLKIRISIHKNKDALPLGSHSRICQESCQMPSGPTVSSLSAPFKYKN